MMNQKMNNPQKKSRPQDKWDAKAGMISKTYKVKKDTADAFKTACEKSNVAIGIQLTRLMEEYIQKVEKQSSSGYR